MGSFQTEKDLRCRRENTGKRQPKEKLRKKASGCSPPIRPKVQREHSYKGIQVKGDSHISPP